MKKVIYGLAAATALGFLLAIIGVALTVQVTGSSIIGNQLEETYVRSVVGENVVKVIGARGSGTGFYVKYGDSNLIMTNVHVCMLKSANNTLMILRYKEDVKFIKKVLFMSKTADICFLEGDSQREGLSVADSASKVGDKIYIAGHPYGQPLTVSYGFMIGEEQVNVVMEQETEINGQVFVIPVRRDFTAVQFHAYAKPGSSGSPITDIFGNVVSILFAGQGSDNFMTFGMPLQEINSAFLDYAKLELENVGK